MKQHWITAAFFIAAGTAFAQSPYAGSEQRGIKALSPQQIDDLRGARGMGLALAAELNGYPGPLHVLELAAKLDVSEAQRAQIERLYEAMKQEAQALGARLIEQESALDREFANRTITPQKLKLATAAIAETHGALRETHLKYHLTTETILSPAQTKRYVELRGYSHPAAPMQHGGHHKP